MNKLFELLDADLLIGLQLYKLADIVLLVSAIISFLPFTTVFAVIAFSVLSYYYYCTGRYVVSYLCVLEVLIKVFYAIF